MSVKWSVFLGHRMYAPSYRRVCTSSLTCFFLLQGCGSADTCLKEACLFDPPVSVASSASGTVNDVAALNFDGTVVPKRITRNGIERVAERETFLSNFVYFSDGTANYLVRTAADGESFAFAGYDPSGSSVGSYLSVASEAPNAGTAYYTGIYVGHLIAGGGPQNEIRGTSSVAVNFETGALSGTIGSRAGIWPGTAVDNEQTRENLSFSGIVVAGVGSAMHMDANSSGSVELLFFESGAVGAVEAEHYDVLGSGNTVHEVGVLAAQ